MDPGPCSRFSRIISPVTRSRASSQLMGSYPETPRFWMLRSPSGSQSTRLSGVRTRFGEYTIERVLTPLKRVDWDPEGERNIQNRGVSGYEPISWDEALDLVTGAMIREKREHGPGSLFTTCRSHHLWGNIGYRHSAYYRFLNLMGMAHCAHNPDSWEGWHWGAMPMWGNSHRLGIPEQYDLLEDALKYTEMIVFWSADPESTGGGIYSAFESTSRRYWMK